MDDPCDIDDRCAERLAEGEQGHLCGWIDRLIFQIGSTQSRDHAPIRYVKRLGSDSLVVLPNDDKLRLIVLHSDEEIALGLIGRVLSILHANHHLVDPIR